MDKENNTELLKAKIGNLEVQISEYRQIVEELSEKLAAYESKYGRVFVKTESDS